MQSADCISQTISSFQQEIKSRLKLVVASVNKIQSRVNSLENESLSNNIVLSDYVVQTSIKNPDHKSIILKILRLIDVHVPPEDFHAVYIPTSNSIKIIFLNKTHIHQIHSNYIERLKTKNVQIFSEVLELFNAEKIQIIFEGKLSNMGSRVNQIELREAAKDIKVGGIPIQTNSGNANIPESRYVLKEMILQIFRKFVPNITSRDFTLRRIAKSSNVIASFYDVDLRDEVYYQYISYLTKEREPKGNKSHDSTNNPKTAEKNPAGIPANVFDLPHQNRITFSEHLTSTVRDQFAFARSLKQNGKIFAFSTRRGRLVIKMNRDDAWKVINHVNELMFL